MTDEKKKKTRSRFIWFVRWEEISPIENKTIINQTYISNGRIDSWLEERELAGDKIKTCLQIVKHQ